MEANKVIRYFKYYSNENMTDDEDVKLMKVLKNLREDSNEVIDVNIFSSNFYRFLIHESNLDSETKADLAIKFEKIRGLKLNKYNLNSEIKTLNDLIEIYQVLFKKGTYNFDYMLLGHPIPVKVYFSLKSARLMNPRHIEVTFSVHFLEKTETFSSRIEQKDLIDYRLEYNKITFAFIMEILGLSEFKTNMSEYEKLIFKTNTFLTKNGIQFKTNKLAVKLNKWELKEKGLDKNGEFTNVIIEHTLESIKSEGSSLKYVVPFVRVFSLQYKNYFYVHVNDLEECVYEKNIFSKLIINETTKNILSKVFATNQKEYLGDFIKNKHGGMVILAEGSPGVGKTSSAEVYAETLEKPLYIAQIDEFIGRGDFSDFEKNLSKIFDRVQKWEAVLLFDEIDVFLYKRENNLSQSAIVGVFLRLLDYFSGLIFFTTNRTEVLDKAILSRVSLKISFPDLDENTQKLIWQNKLIDANVKIDSLNLLPKMKLDGRRIKNALRLSKIVYGNNLKEKEVKILLENYL